MSNKNKTFTCANGKAEIFRGRTLDVYSIWGELKQTVKVIDVKDETMLITREPNLYDKVISHFVTFVKPKK